jgi:hypothetical protein
VKLVVDLFDHLLDRRHSLPDGCALVACFIMWFNERWISGILLPHVASLDWGILLATHNPYIDRRPDAFVGEVITAMRLQMSGGDHLHSGTVVGKLEGDRAISAASLGSSVGSWTVCLMPSHEVYKIRACNPARCSRKIS